MLPTLEQSSGKFWWSIMLVSPWRIFPWLWETPFLCLPAVHKNYWSQFYETWKDMGQRWTHTIVLWIQKKVANPEFYSFTISNTFFYTEPFLVVDRPFAAPRASRWDRDKCCFQTCQFCVCTVQRTESWEVLKREKQTEYNREQKVVHRLLHKSEMRVRGLVFVFVWLHHTPYKSVKYINCQSQIFFLWGGGYVLWAFRNSAFECFHLSPNNGTPFKMNCLSTIKEYFKSHRKWRWDVLI